MKNPGSAQAIGTLALLAAGLWLQGCKSAPDLTQSEAQALIQAKYDQTPPAGATITIDDLGMRQGLAAKYWTKSKDYPNRFWADFTLTPEGRKALTLAKGGDVIQWRPESASDTHFSLIAFTVAANHLKARNVEALHDEVLPDASAAAKEAMYTESVSLDGVPGPLQEIAHNPGNKLSTKHQADFAFEAGAWKLHSIE